jgi:hypothetical protein
MYARTTCARPKLLWPARVSTSRCTTRTFGKRRAISSVASVEKLSTITTSSAHASCASVRPMFGSSSRVRISGVI